MNASNLTPTQDEVLKIVSKAKKPMPRSKIQSAIYGTTNNRNNDRTIQLAIKSLRDMGYVIVSNSDHSGYKLATTQAEVDHYVAERKKAASQMVKTAMRVHKAFQMRGQMSLSGVGG